MTDDLVGRLEAWADNDAEYGHHGRAADWLAAKARIEALEGENRRLREAVSNVQYEADREHGGLAHLKRAISNAARAALAEDKSDG